jgi:hypothetical protein
MKMTPEGNGDLCKMTMRCFRDVDGSLSSLPGLIKEIIESKAWEIREHNGRIYELPSLMDLVTRKPLEGWGEDPKKIEALIKDDPEALEMWENELNPGKGGDNGNQYAKKVGNNNNVMIARKAIQGNSKAHSLSVLKRKAPDMFQAVCNGELTANAAMIQAGLRKSVVSVGANPASAAKTLKKKFGLDYVKELIKELSKQ